MSNVSTLAELLARAGELKAVSDSPELDLQLLLCSVLDKPRSYLYTWPERSLSFEQQQQFEQLLQRRLDGEPIAHILGQGDFWTLTLEVNSSTLIPRPETELLVELALAMGEQLDQHKVRVADLGTGTGAIALALASEQPRWQISAVEFNPQAAVLAERNRQRLKLNNVEVLQGSWCEPLCGSFDLIISNPPYIDAEDPHLSQGDVRFEPSSALVAAQQGLADILTITEQALDRLKPGGWLMFEHGFEQGEPVREILRRAGYQQVETHRDLAGHERATVGQFPPTGEPNTGDA
ncbi:peptide chain release factor N(5)-glutamine methyltransferase [Motiliproteus coralliicola]|uniref:peptide chain release factor N(5)-glutamine methyltransferase n=1 Tax=Motiliproteus coralliicola TaxID=2283196 RepID=UPI001A9E705B|nr:peptide chain release factor N(5)-glutamine methyltransferase [Motiliproteus coralliicola]